MFEILEASIYNSNNTVVSSNVPYFHCPYSSIIGISDISSEKVEIYLVSGLVVEGLKPENYDSIVGDYALKMRQV